MVNEHPAWIIFYGTLTTTVRAADERRAFDAFLGALQPHGSEFGRVVLPVRSEVTIRRPLASDRGWIEDSADPAFIALLPELVDA